VNYSDPAVISALIQAVGSVVAAVIAAVCVGIIGKQIGDRQRLREHLEMALGDIAFLLAVEAEHCERHQRISHQSFKQGVRKVVSDRGLRWSGRFTPGRVKALLEAKDIKLFALAQQCDAANS